LIEINWSLVNVSSKQVLEKKIEFSQYVL
jgi:hypothetical protein